MKLDNVDLNKLMNFLAIAESGAVTAAAQRVGLTRSAVSHSLRSLEEQLGLQLFHRVGKRLALTNEGRILRATCGDVRARLSETLDELQELGREVRGPVRLGLFLGFSRFRLANIVDAFVREHPSAEVRITFGSQSELTEQLLVGKLDLALALRAAGEQAARIRSLELPATPLVLATRPERARPRSFEQIGLLSFVDYYRSDPLIDRWTGHHFAGKRVPRERIRVWAASSDLALELVLRGTGAAILPADIVEPYRKAKQLAIIPGSKGPLVDHIWLNELAGPRHSRAVSTFRQLVLPTA